RAPPALCQRRPWLYGWGRQVLGQHLKCSESRRERSRRGGEGRWNGAGARTGLTLEVTHCGPARVWPRERPHTTVGPTCYAFIIGAPSAWGEQHGSTRPDAKISNGVGKEAQGVRVRARAEA